MFLSKSSGYAIRGIMYLSLDSSRNRRVQLEEIAETLHVPRFFLGKVMKRVAKEGILDSVKGHSGGFSINDQTIDTSLYRIAEIMGELTELKSCVLRFKECNKHNPCPLHEKVEPARKQWIQFLQQTTIRNLLESKQKSILGSIKAD